MNFEWDNKKNEENLQKHGIKFEYAQYAFSDPQRIIALDKKHSSKKEKRYFCFGNIKNRIVTVRFTYRNNKIRIFGAGFWREGTDIYETKN